MNLDGKVAVVTGASRGIGRAIALSLANDGADIACIATSEENALAVAAEVRAMGRRSLALGCRVEDGADVERAFARTVDTLGAVDILVNNAGISQPKPILEMAEADWDRHLDVNCKSVFLCGKTAAASMLAAGTHGTIINVGSIAGNNAFPNRLAYCSSKAAVHQMTKVMAIEWAEYGIRVNCVAPGYTATEMIEGLVEQNKLDVVRLENRIPQRRLGTPAEVAEAVLFFAREQSSYVTGSVLYVDGGWDAYGFVAPQ